MVKSITNTNAVESTAPQTIGISNNICKAMAAPSISASDVETEAMRAVPSTVRACQAGA